jgi:hypothetical protein
MVPPVDFGFNEETAADNAWQTRPAPTGEIRSRACAEFDGFAAVLTAAGVHVMRLEKPATARMATPDAVFPNNWFSTTAEGSIVIYTAATPNRRAERHPATLERLLQSHGYDIRSYVYIGRIEESVRVLEGTGSMVFDHRNRVSYASRSARTHPEAFWEFVRLRGHSGSVLFDTRDPQGRPIYHTNVMLSIGDQFAVVCTDCIVPEDRARVLERLAWGREVIEISMDQMMNGFCGNILALESADGKPLIAMSSRAHAAFGEEGRQRLSKHGALIHAPLDTIESIGGGSARCMLAEIFLPRMTR